MRLIFHLFFLSLFTWAHSQATNTHGRRVKNDYASLFAIPYFQISNACDVRCLHTVTVKRYANCRREHTLLVCGGIRKVMIQLPAISNGSVNDPFVTQKNVSRASIMNHKALAACRCQVDELQFNCIAPLCTIKGGTRGRCSDIHY